MEATLALFRCPNRAADLGTVAPQLLFLASRATMADGSCVALLVVRGAPAQAGELKGPVSASLLQTTKTLARSPRATSSPGGATAPNATM
jgi:hypothetical protein